MACEVKILESISSVAIISGDEIELDDELRSLGIDSLTLTQLIITLEDILEIEFDDSDLDPNKLKKVSDIIELAEKYMK